MVATAMITLCAGFVATAWATLSLIKSEETPATAQKTTLSQQDVVSYDLPEKPKSRAPEPSSLFLFGSGIFGMIISFVRRTYQAVKRVFDVIASVLGLIILLPLMALTALLIKLTSRGPIFYSQARIGKDGEEFEMYKFRTMRVDAEKYTGAIWAAENDPRLIPVGKFLRKAHIDELPQLINILQGDMSLIGPRPERPMFVAKFKTEIPDYEKRLMVKPGLTGLAQVWHKYDETIEDVKKKIKYDLLYIKKLCLWTDVRILLRTVLVVFTGQGAR